jgi:NO-binding membrane sensor protein with MHYT domain
MHFIGNRAIDLHGGNGQIAYSSGYTAASFFLPIIVLFGAFYLLATTERANYYFISASGFLTGAAVCGMHYVGQLGIGNYHCEYRVANVIGAAFIAILASLVALSIFFRSQETWTNNWMKRSLCGCILACAVSGMHWTATVGTEYRSRGNGSNDSRQMSRTQVVIVCTILVSSDLHLR